MATISRKCLLILVISTFIVSSSCAPDRSIGEEIMSSNVTDDVNDVFKFFPDCNNNGLNLRWAHAVNSWPYLNETLGNESIHRVHMMEGDVIIRQQSHDDIPVPVMAHPPATDSNLTFHDWLITINQFHENDSKTDQGVTSKNDQIRAGAKADFKSLDAAIAALQIVQQNNKSLAIPLWLNADIVHGPPGGSAKPVDPQKFLRACTDYAPGLTLSLGWTTPPNIDQFRCRRGYAWREILNLFNQLKPFINETAASGNLPRITFAVRAALVKSSYFRLMGLLDMCASAAGGDQYADQFSITLWTSASADQLTIDDYVIITQLRLTLGRNRVFIDLPDQDIGCLRELDPFGSATDQLKAFDSRRWELIDPDNAVITGQRLGVLFLGSTTAHVKSIHQVSKSNLNLRLIFIPDQQSSISSQRSSILISIIDHQDQIAWTLEISNTKCTVHHSGSISNHDCFQIQPDQTYSISIGVDGRHIKVDWKTEDEDLAPRFEIPAGLSSGCDATLNCTSTSSSNSKGSNGRTLNHDIGNFKFLIQKIGTGDFIMEKLVIES